MKFEEAIIEENKIKKLAAAALIGAALAGNVHSQEVNRTGRNKKIETVIDDDDPFTNIKNDTNTSKVMNDLDEKQVIASEKQKKENFERLKKSFEYNETESEGTIKMGYQISISFMKDEQRKTYEDLKKQYLNKKITREEATKKIEEQLNYNNKNAENMVHFWYITEVPLNTRKAIFKNISKDYFKDKINNEELYNRLMDVLHNDTYAHNLVNYWNNSKLLIKDGYYPKIY